jgi:ABC-type amino acid transport substrate-binding protein
MFSRIVLMLLIAFSAYATDTLRVNLYEFEPLVSLQDKTKPTGFDVELWEKLALELNLSYKYTIVPKFSDIFTNLQDNLADVAISGITITDKREESIDFSHKYYDSGLSILIRSADSGGIIAQFLQYLGILKKLGSILIFYLFFLVIMAFLFNRVEKWPIFDCCYFVNTIISTVGFGDISAKSKLGKILVQLTMVIGIGIFSIITGSISSEITVQKLTYKITCPEDLRGKKVAVEEGTTSVDAVMKLGAHPVTVENIKKGVEALRGHSVDAVVYDLPGILYLANNNSDIVAVPTVFDKQTYGIALQQGSSLRDKINCTLLKMMSNGEYQKNFGKETL